MRTKSILLTGALLIGANALMAAQAAPANNNWSISFTRQSWAAVPRRKRLV